MCRYRTVHADLPVSTENHPAPSQGSLEKGETDYGCPLKNLVARTPKMEDVVAINELIAACEIATYGRADSSLEDLASNRQRLGFNLTTDTWVIVIALSL